MKKTFNPKIIVEEIITFLKQKALEANTAGFAVGISGGIDSSVIARIVQLTENKNYKFVFLPCESLPEDHEAIIELVKKFDFEYTNIDLSQEYQEIQQTLISNLKLSAITTKNAGNIKARLRMLNLYAIANQFNYLVVGTSNACEWYMGYFTKHGDGAADVAPLLNFTKSEVYELAKYLGIPKLIINRPPSAGLWSGQTDEKEMGVTYKDIEKVIKNQKIDFNARLIIKNQHLKTKHKRCMIANLKLKKFKN